jgi:hypothetical protein
MSDLDDLIGRIHDLADEVGWKFRVGGASESTVSVYIDLWRECRGEDDTDESIEDYGMTGVEEISVRISNHGNAHHHDGERVHVRLDGDAEADIEKLRVRLSRPAREEPR